jgi:protein O-mannosyl-transferase
LVVKQRRFKDTARRGAMGGETGQIGAGGKSRPLPATGTTESSRLTDRAGAPVSAFSRSGDALALGAVLLVTAAAYFRCLSNRFVFDDEIMIVTNRYIGQWSFIWKSLANDSWWFRDPLHLPQSSYYRPLQDIWLALNFHLFHLDPRGWHAAMIGLHLVGVWLVYRIASRLARDSSVGLVTALIFGVLPIHAETVIWPSAIPLLLVAVLELGAFSLIVDGERVSALNSAFAILLYALALFTHESAVVFPAIVALYGFYFEPSGNEGEPSAASAMLARVRRALVTALPFAIETAGYLIVRHLVLGFIVRPNPLNRMSMTQGLLTIPHVLVTYLQLLAVPWLASPSHRMLIVTSPLAPQFYLPLLLIGLLVGAFVFAVRKLPNRNLYFFCAGWMAVAIAPMLDLPALFKLELVQDRYLYLVSFGWCLMVSELAVRAVRRTSAGRLPILAGVTGIASLFAVMLWRTEHLWRDDFTLFTRCIETFPESSTCHHELGTALLRRGDFKGARSEFAKCVALDPDNGSAMYDLGVADAVLGQVEQGIAEVSGGIKRMPEPAASLYVGLAELYRVTGHEAQSEATMKLAESLPGGDVAVGIARAHERIKESKLGEAETILSALASRHSDDYRVWTLLGQVLETENRGDAALDTLQRAIELAPPDPKPYFLAAEILHKMNRESEAARRCRMALALAPDDAKAEVLMADIEHAQASR